MIDLFKRFLKVFRRDDLERKYPGLYFKIRLPYRLRRFFRFDLKQRFCKHRECYYQVDWTRSTWRCSRCHKDLSSRCHDERVEQ